MMRYGVLLILIVINFFAWRETSFMKPSWSNVPPAPNTAYASLSTLGDKELAYRMNALMLQNLGNTRGDVMSLTAYNYGHLKDWFFLQDSLNPVSDVTPMMAAYYFGAVNNRDKVKHVLDFLEIVGQRPEGEKWRWLGHAVYIAHHHMNDLDRAYELAVLLSQNKSPDLGDWARQMPAFILQARGESDLAYEVMLNILKDSAESLHPNEVNYMIDYMCNTLLGDRLNKPEFCAE